MRVLLDEMLPIGVREFLAGHDVVSAAYAGFGGLPNGVLISRAVAAGFVVIVTLDRGIEHQQNLSEQDIGFVLIPDNDVELIRLYADRLLAAIEKAAAGTVVRIGPGR